VRIVDLRKKIALWGGSARPSMHRTFSRGKTARRLSAKRSGR